MTSEAHGLYMHSMYLLGLVGLHGEMNLQSKDSQ